LTCEVVFSSRGTCHREPLYAPGMAFGFRGVQFLVEAKRSGVVFDSTMMLGRQLLGVPRSRLGVIKRLIADVDQSRLPSRQQPPSSSQISLGSDSQTDFSDSLLEALGARTIDSIDKFEDDGSSLKHDLNEMLPPDLGGQYSVVIDGGTLEHVFNFPQALRESMRMVAVGGHFLGMIGTDGAGGHGFYQVSPDLIYRSFSECNGFKLLWAATNRGVFRHWFFVNDPAALRYQEFTSCRPTLLYFCAQRIDDSDPLTVPPNQSLYERATFNGGGVSGATLRLRARSISLRRVLHGTWIGRRMASAIYGRMFVRTKSFGTVRSTN